MFLLAAIMVAGTISMTIPKSFALDFQESFANDYKKDPKSTNVQEIKCINSNININGVDVHKRQAAGAAEGDAAANAIRENGQNGQRNGLFDGLNIDRNLVNICVDVNLNHQFDDQPE